MNHAFHAVHTHTHTNTHTQNVTIAEQRVWWNEACNTLCPTAARPRMPSGFLVLSRPLLSMSFT